MSLPSTTMLTLALLPGEGVREEWSVEVEETSLLNIASFLHL